MQSFQNLGTDKYGRTILRSYSQYSIPHYWVDGVLQQFPEYLYYHQSDTWKRKVYTGGDATIPEVAMVNVYTGQPWEYMPEYE